MSYNKIGGSGAAFLSDALKVNTTLTKLDLSRNRYFGIAGADALSNAT